MGQRVLWLLKPHVAGVVEYLSLMNKTYTTLDHLERTLIAIPTRIEDVDVEYAEDGRTFAINITHFDGSKVLVARQVGDSDSDTYDVSIDIWSRVRGQVRYTKTVAFTTTKGWVEEWLWMAQAHAPVA
jgi:hypothetical protein